MARDQECCAPSCSALSTWRSKRALVSSLFSGKDANADGSARTRNRHPYTIVEGRPRNPASVDCLGWHSRIQGGSHPKIDVLASSEGQCSRRCPCTQSFLPQDLCGGRDERKSPPARQSPGAGSASVWFKLEGVRLLIVSIQNLPRSVQIHPLQGVTVVPGRWTPLRWVQSRVSDKASWLKGYSVQRGAPISPLLESWPEQSMPT